MAKLTVVTDPPEEELPVFSDATGEKVRSYGKLCDQVARSRSKLNAKIAKGKADLIDAGLDRKALEAAIKAASTPANERKAWDHTYNYVREMLGCPVQIDMFANEK